MNSQAIFPNKFWTETQKRLALGDLKKTAAIGVLFLFLAISGSHTIFIRYVKSQKLRFRTELLRTGCNAAFTYTISTTALFKDHTGIEWKDEGKELVLDGKYHEILSIVYQNNVATLLLMPDAMENQLFSHYFYLRHTNDGALPGVLFHLMGLLFLHHLPSTFCVLEGQVLHTLNDGIQVDVTSFTEKIIKPPALFI